MSSIKRYIEQVEAEEDMNSWIRGHVDIGVEEGDKEWEEKKVEYLSGGNWEEDGWDYDVDYDIAFGRLSSKDKSFNQFKEQLDILIDDIPQAPSDMSLKMIYSYAITLMETCLGDMIRVVLLSDPKFIRNAINKVDDLSKTKLSLKDVFEVPDIVSRCVLKTFSEYLYHNIDKVVKVYSLVLDIAPPENVKEGMKDVSKITVIRHDIVHRNGFDKDGNKAHLDKQIVLKAIGDIYSFVESMTLYVESAMVDGEF